MKKAISNLTKIQNKGNTVQKSTQEISTKGATYTAKNTKLFPYCGSKMKYASIFDKAHANKMKKVKVYIEAFGGTLASLFHNLKFVKADKYIINDLNPRLINLFKEVKNNPELVYKKFVALETEFQRITPKKFEGSLQIKGFDQEECKTLEDFYLEARSLLNKDIWGSSNAALFIFIMKHCFNGKYNEKNGAFDVNFNWKTCKASSLKSRLNDFKTKILNLSDFFNQNNVVFESLDVFELIEKYNDKDTFIYLDPPYVNSKIHYVTQKQDNNFEGLDTHLRMLDICNKQYKYVMYSNHMKEAFSEVFDSFTNFERTNTITQNTQKASKIEILALKANYEQIQYTPIDKLLNVEIYYQEVQVANNIEEVIIPSIKEATNDSVLRVGTAFSGIGAPEQALKEMGFAIQNEFMVEIDKFARQTYLANHKVNKVYEDITKVNPKELPDIDLFVFGSPCQSFSLAGKRGGFEDTRGTLIFNGLEIIKEKQPKYFIYENVKGLLSHDGGKTFDTVLNAFAELGYDFQYKVLNTKDFGLPQNRERIFIVGTRQDLDQKFSFPTPQGIKTSVNDFIKKDKNMKYKTFNTSNIVASKPSKRSQIQITYTIPHLKFQADRRICSTEGISPCLTCGGTKTKFFDTKNQVFRYLSIQEMGQVQGFRNFKFPVSDSQAKKQLGNSMSVNVIQALYQELLADYLPISEEETYLQAA